MTVDTVVGTSWRAAVALLCVFLLVQGVRRMFSGGALAFLVFFLVSLAMLLASFSAAESTLRFAQRVAVRPTLAPYGEGEAGAPTLWFVPGSFGEGAKQSSQLRPYWHGYFPTIRVMNFGDPASMGSSSIYDHDLAVQVLVADIREWRSHNPNGTAVLLGASLGGRTVLQAAEILKREGIYVDVIVQSTPWGWRDIRGSDGYQALAARYMQLGPITDLFGRSWTGGYPPSFRQTQGAVNARPLVLSPASMNGVRIIYIFSYGDELVRPNAAVLDGLSDRPITTLTFSGGHVLFEQEPVANASVHAFAFQVLGYDLG